MAQRLRVAIYTLIAVALASAPWSVLAQPPDRDTTQARSITHAPEIDVEALLSGVRERGPTHVLRQLLSKRSTREELLKRTASGTPKWVELSIALVRVAKADFRRELRVALEDALVVSSKNTLKHLSANRSAMSMVCGRSAHQNSELAANSLDERLSAVLTLRMGEQDNKDVLKIIDMCADRLEKADVLRHQKN